MRALPVAVAALLMLALTGCPPAEGWRESPPADPDGVACEDSAGAQAVRIDVEYAGAEPGTPSEECEVDPGTMLTWRGPLRGQAFQLRFHEASPAGAGAPLLVESSESGGQHRVRMAADNASGRYEYDIVSGGAVVDPAIIIRAR
jgi:hypothetical protein